MKNIILAGVMLALLAVVIPHAHGGDTMSFSITSPDFNDKGPIPKRFTCDGDDISPELDWANPPAGTKSFAMIVEDPDAPVGTFVHWIIYDMPVDWSGLKRGMKAEDGAAQGVKQGRTDFDAIGWGGPCPPRGHGRHRYIFSLKALDIPSLGLANGAEKASFNKALKGHVLDEAVVMGVYKR